MGYAIASAFKNAGAEVTLITGPTNIDKPIGLANIIEVTSAEEMHAAADKYFSKTDIAVLSAAVADYKAATQATEKIKKTDDSNEMMLKLVKTPDIAKSLGAKKKAHQQIIGFALETENEESNAKKKLQNKNFDLIVLNSLRNEKSAFGYDTNQVKIFDKNGLKYESALLPKSEIAQIILEQITQE
jgi:phosphopantothenoylcysteine decarboxylase/phosphopantothenate--cysteine ligase